MKLSLKLCFLVAALVPATSSAALVSLVVTGFNNDIVYGAGEIGGSISGSMDAGPGFLGATWYGVGRNVDAPTTGLPIGTVVSSTVSDLSFTLQPFAGGNNAMLLNATQSAAFTLTTPAAFTRLALIGSTGNGTGNNVVTVSFADGSTQVFASLDAGINTDWFGGSEIAYTAAGRSTTDTAYDNVNGTQPRLYQDILVLNNTTSNVTSVSIVNNGTGHTAIMAVSGEFSAIPEPSAVALLGAFGLIGLARRRRA